MQAIKQYCNIMQSGISGSRFQSCFQRQTPLETYAPRDFEQEKRYMASQWCGCGAVPGANLAPLKPCERPNPIRPLTIPGYAAGPHGFDTYTWDSMPNIGSEWPLIANIPDRSVDLDPMDGRIWGASTTDSLLTAGSGSDPYQPWTYSLGAWP